jgi:hypothetical protein
LKDQFTILLAETSCRKLSAPSIISYLLREGFEYLAWVFGGWNLRAPSREEMLTTLQLGERKGRSCSVRAIGPSRLVFITL